MSYIKEKLKDEVTEGVVRAGTSEFIDFMKDVLVAQLAKETKFGNNPLVKQYVSEFLQTKLGDGVLALALSPTMPLLSKILPENMREYSDTLGSELRKHGFANIIQPVMTVLPKPVEAFIAQQLGISGVRTPQQMLAGYTADDLFSTSNSQEKELVTVGNTKAKKKS